MMSEKITIYHNNQCSKSREALSILKEGGVDLEIVEYLKEVQSSQNITDLLTKLGISALELMRKGEKDYLENVKGKSLTEPELIDLLVKFPKLIERPIVIKGNKAIIGRPPTLVVDFIVTCPKIS
jgi:arsenate reductase